MKRIIMFYGKTCIDNTRIMSWIEKLERNGFKFEKLETWKNEEGAKRVREYSDLMIKGCGRDTIVPSFIDGKRVLCNPRSFEELEKWVNG